MEVKRKKTYKLNFYDKLFESYRKEIDCLWQRSVFLGAFLVLIFTGYGFLVKELIGGNSICCTIFGYVRNLHVVMLIVSFLGLVFSVLWVLMAKGSKFWQEVYEKKIREFEDALGIKKVLAGDMKEDDFKEKCSLELNLLSNVQLDEMNQSIFSLKVGSFSVGKVNIFIGQVFYLVWSLAFVFHFTCLWTRIPVFSWDVLIPIILSVLIIVIVTYFIKDVNKGALA